MISYTVNQISEILKAELIGNSNTIITGAEEIQKATKNQITFIGSNKYKKYWPNSKALVAIVHKSITIEPENNRTFLKVENVDLAMAKVLELYTPNPPILETEIHPTAVIHETANLAKGCKIGANCYIGKNVEIGENTILYPNVCVFDESIIGKNTTLWSGTVIRERCIIGDNCILHINVSIGADGFGFRPCPENGLAKIPQIGNVVIGNCVEIGANSCVDRAKFSSTIIGDGCKIDNLVQIAHNSTMGRFCIMAGHSGLAGSVTLGDGVIIGGSASIKDHTTIHSGATVGAGSGVIGDVDAGKTVLGYPAQDARDMLKQWVTVKKMVRNQN